MRSTFGALVGMVVFSFSLSAQASGSDDARIDQILANQAVTEAQAVWLVARAVGLVDEAVPAEDAYPKAVSAGWLLPGEPPEGPITLAGFSQVLVKALGIPTGIVYAVFPGPRYAFRELLFRRILPQGASPGAAVSGQEALTYLQNAQNWKEGRT